MATFPYHSTVIKVMTIERPTMALETQLRRKKYVKLGVLGDFGETVWVHESIDGGLSAATQRYEGFKQSWKRYAGSRATKSFREMIQSEPLSIRFQGTCDSVEESPLVDIMEYRFRDH